MDFKIAMQRLRRNGDLLEDRCPFLKVVQARPCTFVKIAFIIPLLKV